MTHVCVGNLTIIGSNNGLSPGRRQAITRTNAEISLIRPLGDFVIKIYVFLLKMLLKMLSVKWWTFCLCL